MRSYDSRRVCRGDRQDSCVLQCARSGDRVGGNTEDREWEDQTIEDMKQQGGGGSKLVCMGECALLVDGRRRRLSDVLYRLPTRVLVSYMGGGKLPFNSLIKPID